jgi:pimeloyl-ACP methyl ester carboxylesterase|tara:strand:- start:1546 stop:2379 length:834 start_codon:yes stop_codon:yes gene_type:complete
LCFFNNNKLFLHHILKNLLNYYSYPHTTSKEWVTFVHGAGGSSSIWFKQVRDFKKHFNVLILDLRGHGNSKPKLKDTFKIKYTFDSITSDIVEVIDSLKIEKSHFIGISLGTILIRNLAEKRPELVKSMIMGGAIIKMNFRSQVLMKVGNIFKSVVPYMMLYKLFAFIIMPKKNHKKSRLLFVNEAKKLYQKEFLRWFKLTSEINPLLRFFRTKDINIPTLYVMGAEDHLFLPSIKNIVAKHVTSSLFVIDNCGHVVNVEQPEAFNNQTIGFINSLA